jgi:hypothetical protein
MLQNSIRIEAGYRALLDEAVAAGELKACDTRRLARAVGAMSGGSLIGWAVHRRGTAKAWVRGDLTTLLDPHKASGHARRKRGASRSRRDSRRPKRTRRD